MVTVATNLDVPIKLLFPRPGTTSTGAPALAMLGLGDVVLPGLIIAMSLRWDLWRFYEHHRRSLVAAASLGNLPPADELKALKPRYTKATGTWGARFWDFHAAGAFPKPYFHASLVGYVVGLMTTLGVMHIFHHAQPALLYLVPAVVGSVWGTALVKGEAGELWRYTEEGDADLAPAETKKEEECCNDVKGEAETTVLTVNVVRRPAFGDGLKVEKKKVKTEEAPRIVVEPPMEEETETEEELSEDEDEDEDEGSVGSGEVVEAKMWETAVIGRGEN